ncbi:kinase-like protein [Moniliophthora roreri MCA 2997]|uniref:Kinase-like protein n=1 Tax=Moniliophthora roreri (strain MCA 2997) TaxID=1381753 RepID=V2WST4_MONRO|nr:kinase-like protein [Moniliophthora roreri MCA 2997]
MSSLDIISSLVESQGYQHHLLQVCLFLSFTTGHILKETPGRFLQNANSTLQTINICDALHKDEEAIIDLLNSAIELEGNKFKDALPTLKGEDMQSCADLIQDVIDKCSLEHDKFKHKAQHLLVKLCKDQDVLPSSLFIKGVILQDTNAHFGGSFGDIYGVTYNGLEVVIKWICVFQNTVASEQHKIFRRLCQEALLWQALKHPFLLLFFGVDSDTFPGFFCLVSPWMVKRTILKHLEENGGQDVDLRLFKIAQGLAYLHSQHIIHGDLHGSNILIDLNCHVCIADFGLAVFSDVTVGTNSSHHAGSVLWMAPELHQPMKFGLEYYQRMFASDTYSFACVCVELYMGRPLFEHVSRDTAALLKIIAGEQPPQPLNMGEWLWTVVERCWNQEKHVRPSMSEAVEMMQSGSPERELVLSFSVQQSSGGASDAAYPQHIMHGQTAHMLPIITSLDYALDEIDLTSGIETPIKTGYTFDDMSVGQTVGIVKKKKKLKMHACEICHKLFLHSLKMHMITHNNLKSFICNFPGCNRSFTVCSNAKQHLQTHGVTPESFMPSSPNYVVNFDTPVVPDLERHPLSSLPAKLKWMPTSLLDRNNMTTLRSISEDGEESDSDSDELEDDPVICIWKIYQLTWQVT